MKSLLILLLFSSSLWAETRILKIGQSTFLENPKQTRVIISNGSPISVKDSGAKIRVSAKSLGESEIRMGQREVKIQVIAKKLFNRYQQIQNALEGSRGLSLSIKNACIQVGGRLLRWSDWKRIAKQLAYKNAKNPAACKDSFMFAASISPLILNKVQQEFRILFQQKNLHPLDLKFQPQAFAPLPKVPESEAEVYYQTLLPYGFSFSKTQKQIYLEPMVEIAVFMAEIKNSFWQRLGLDLPKSLSASKASGSWQVQNKELLAQLHGAQSEGMAKILAKPKLLCQSGKKANFFSGGEIPIRVKGFNGSVSWKKYGISLEVAPQIDQSGRIQLMVTNEISTIDSANSLDGIPALQSNRVHTVFNLKKEESIVLSGLIQKNWGNHQEGLAFLQKVPILNLLFASEDYRKNQSELVIILQPKIINPYDLPNAKPEQWIEDELARAL